MAPPMKVSQFLTERGTEHRQKADKNVNMARKRYKKGWGRRVSLALIFQVGVYAFLDRPPLLRSAAERYAPEGYMKLMMRKQGP